MVGFQLTYLATTRDTRMKQATTERVALVVLPLYLNHS